MAGTEPLSAARTPSTRCPSDRQVFDRRAGADLGARLLDRGDPGPGNTPVMAPLKADAQSGRVLQGPVSSPNGTSASSARASAARSHGCNVRLRQRLTWCCRVYTSVTGSISGYKAGTGCQEALSEGPAVAQPIRMNTPLEALRYK